MSQMEFKGRVIKEAFAKGSKSEREAVMLDTGKTRYVLRRQGGNPFSDPALDKLVGKNISAVGIVSGYTLLMSEWKVTSDT